MMNEEYEPWESSHGESWENLGKDVRVMQSHGNRIKSLGMEWMSWRSKSWESESWRSKWENCGIPWGEFYREEIITMEEFTMRRLLPWKSFTMRRLLPWKSLPWESLPWERIREMMRNRIFSRESWWPWPWCCPMRYY